MDMIRSLKFEFEFSYMGINVFLIKNVFFCSFLHLDARLPSFEVNCTLGSDQFDSEAFYAVSAYF